MKALAGNPTGAGTGISPLSDWCVCILLERHRNFKSLLPTWVQFRWARRGPRGTCVHYRDKRREQLKNERKSLRRRCQWRRLRFVRFAAALVTTVAVWEALHLGLGGDVSRKGPKNGSGLRNTAISQIRSKRPQNVPSPIHSFLWLPARACRPHIWRLATAKRRLRGTGGVAPALAWHRRDLIGHQISYVRAVGQSMVEAFGWRDICTIFAVQLPPRRSPITDRRPAPRRASRISGSTDRKRRLAKHYQKTTSAVAYTPRSLLRHYMQCLSA